MYLSCFGAGISDYLVAYSYGGRLSDSKFSAVASHSSSVLNVTLARTRLVPYRVAVATFFIRASKGDCTLILLYLAGHWYYAGYGGMIA